MRYGDRWGPVRPGMSDAQPMQEIVLADGEQFTAFSGISQHYPEILQLNTTLRVGPKFGVARYTPSIFASLDGLLYFSGASKWGIVTQVRMYRSRC